MLNVNRHLGKLVAKYSALSKERSLAPSHAQRRLTRGPGLLQSVYKKFVAPWYFRAISGPYERWQQACLTRYLREHGLLYDDLMSEREPIVERALSLLTPDLATDRYRRIAKGMQISMLRMYPPLEEQNYDPFVPYLAPFIEEAKFQLQEEEELLGYHPTDRRLFCGGTTGFGDLEPGMHFLVSLPNLYGAGIGNPNRK
ncbi:ubiquinol-cytochrome C reductase complex subunit-like protein [Theileria orientalis strain Shintoku]|uniref:Ubiquinol-cytochrome C reductase complex subunit-like protein n=1 Tax=Theileria orientalis strain Shintoku TaxID=869250 RepID=J4C2V5_THEOR|nr:ubiquinol-cytochrome C reductase complex subunit-like protein [Theileria orientalis strain Shintoku]BAM39351.1 ubiquinol-cytochrome C reductase complex subunit-like protein [Theileria orientalis strain Shintoku]|eukprot:XP_009689652.1 ubiquinol-cytochrome C reductase complex subunit-like protein [Theileria orientalis strain Shintoku]